MTMAGKHLYTSTSRRVPTSAFLRHRPDVPFVMNIRGSCTCSCYTVSGKWIQVPGKKIHYKMVHPLYSPQNWQIPKKICWHFWHPSTCNYITERYSGKWVPKMLPAITPSKQTLISQDHSWNSFITSHIYREVSWFPHKNKSFFICQLFLKMKAVTL